MSTQSFVTSDALILVDIFQEVLDDNLQWTSHMFMQFRGVWAVHNFCPGEYVAFYYPNGGRIHLRWAPSECPAIPALEGPVTANEAFLKSRRTCTGGEVRIDSACEGPMWGFKYLRFEGVLGVGLEGPNTSAGTRSVLGGP